MSCHNHSCGTDHGSQASHGSESCCQKSNCSCSCSCCQKSSCDHAQKLLELANQAWMEALKDLMKEHIRANDQSLEELAKIVCCANHERWHNKMAQQKAGMEYEQKLKNLCCSHESQCQVKPSSPGNNNKQGNK